MFTSCLYYTTFSGLIIANKVGDADGAKTISVSMNTILPHPAFLPEKDDVCHIFQQEPGVSHRNYCMRYT
jgi:hypothetical protein